MKEVPPVSIIIPALNEEKYLPLLLASLREIDAPLDVIVVDADSTDGTVEVVKQHAESFTGNSTLCVIENKTRSISFQRNLGAAHAKHDILIFCDADMIVPAGSHELLISEFIEKQHVAAGPRFTVIERDVRIRLLISTLSFVERVSAFFGRALLPGGYLITRKETFVKVGGFDTGLLLAEDVDYSMRAGKEGNHGVLKAPVLLSGRRLTKYGYAWLFKEWANILRLVAKGKLHNPERIYYPFGEY
jgi:glycosyltransferase involved in cell wall biosynthesis